MRCLRTKRPPEDHLRRPFLSLLIEASNGSAQPCKALPPTRPDSPPASSKVSSTSRQSSPDAAVQPLRPASSAEYRSPPCTCPCSSRDQAVPVSGSQSCSTSQSSDVP